MKPLVTSLSIALLLFASLRSPDVYAAEPLRFFAFGDLPYSPSETELLASLLGEVAKRRPEFLVHVGDVKGGNAPCTDRGLGHLAELLRAQPVPVVYTPGDNEWTDCHREPAGGYDPVERLSRLRSLYFADSDVLRLRELEIFRTDTAYPENYWFLRDGVFFVTVHVVGSHNNATPGDAIAREELHARSKANRRHLRAAVEAANKVDALALALLFHANPGIEKPVSPRGFDWFHEDLAALLDGYPGPVLAIHGDTHQYRYDHPLKDLETGQQIRRFTRLEVPGSPEVAGVWVQIEPGSEEPFSVELVTPDEREQLVE